MTQEPRAELNYVIVGAGGPSWGPVASRPAGRPRRAASAQGHGYLEGQPGMVWRIPPRDTGGGSAG